MSVKMPQLRVEPADDAWLQAPQDGKDVTTSEAARPILLAMVRHILRERSDCRQIPVVLAATVHPVNRWGHNFQVEVQYTRRWRAIYAGRIREGGLSDVQCYSD